MKIKMKKIILLSGVILVPFLGKSQDIHFSQFSEAPLILNPALACTRYDTRVSINYRDQWASVTKAYTTYGLSIEKSIKHLKLKKSFVGLSFNLFSDKAGDAGLGNMLANMGINVLIKTGKSSKISGGIGGGMIFRTLNSSNLKWESQYNGYNYDSKVGSGEKIPTSTIIQGDLVAGIDYHYAKSERYISAQDGTKFDIGASISHFNSPGYSFVNTGDRQASRFVAHAAFDIGLKDAKMALVPSLVYVRQGPSEEINAGFMFKFILQDQSVFTGHKKASSISLGAYLRVKDAFIPAMLFQYHKMALGVSYDVNTSALASASKTSGGLEVSLRFGSSPGYGRALGNSGSSRTPKY